MSTVFTIFTPINADKTKLINHLESLYYPIFIDNKHSTDQEWIDAKHSESSKSAIYDAVFFKITDEVEITYKNPDLLVEITDSVKKDYYDYNEIEIFLTNLLKDIIPTTQLLPTDKPQLLTLPKYAGDINPDYELRTELLGTRMYYEVIKPFTDRPYTTVVYDYPTEGHLKFFTNLFVCKSWGICKGDIDFLKQCWIHLEMPGEFDLSQLQKKTLLDIPPKVWRNDLEKVLENQNKLNGFYLSFHFPCSSVHYLVKILSIIFITSIFSRSSSIFSSYSRSYKLFLVFFFSRKPSVNTQVSHSSTRIYCPSNMWWS